VLFGCKGAHEHRPEFRVAIYGGEGGIRTTVHPTLRHKPAMPPQQRRGRDDEGPPPVLRQQPTCRREEQSVDRRHGSHGECADAGCPVRAAARAGSDDPRQDILAANAQKNDFRRRIG
jgi:hypothetical protein